MIITSWLLTIKDFCLCKSPSPKLLKQNLHRRPICRCNFDVIFMHKCLSAILLVNKIKHVLCNKNRIHFILLNMHGDILLPLCAR